LPGRFSAAGRTSAAQVWSLGSAEPGGSVEKWPAAAATVVLEVEVEVVLVVDDVVVVACVVLVVDDVVVVGRDVLVGCAVVDETGRPAATLNVAAPLFHCRNVPQPTLKTPTFTVCTPSASAAGIVQLAL
jgi:hypothetical protein